MSPLLSFGNVTKTKETYIDETRVYLVYLYDQTDGMYQFLKHVDVPNISQKWSKNEYCANFFQINDTSQEYSETEGIDTSLFGRDSMQGISLF